MLVERRSQRGFEASLAARRIADGPGDGTKLLQHLALQEGRGVLDPDALERTFGKIPQKRSRFLIEVVERRRCWRRRGDAASVIAPRRLPQRRDRRELHDERAGRVLFMAADDAATSERIQQSENRLPNDGHAGDALVAASRDDEHLVGAVDLLLSEPGFGPHRRGGCRRQRVTKVQRALRPESRFVECLAKP